MTFDPSNKTTRYRFADLDLIPRQRCVMRGEQLLPMGRLSYDLLALLVTRAPGIVTRSECLDRVWSHRVVGVETLTQRVKLLRHALSDSSSDPRYIELVRGSGYRLLPTVRIDMEPERRRRSVAVLPFENLSSRRRDERFAAGIYEEIVNQLCKLRDIDVLARRDLGQEELSAGSLSEVTRQLGVDEVIGGCIQYMKGRARISAKLVDAMRGTHLWTDVYDYERRDDFAVQSDVARSIAHSIGARL